MTRRFGIDTSVLVRLLTGEPEADFALCVRKLRSLIEEDGAEILVSNQVIGEAYIAVQHHYGVSRDDARAGLLDMLRSGLVAPLNGSTVLAAMEARRGAGLLDRLIADDYARSGLAALTLGSFPRTRSMSNSVMRAVGCHSLLRTVLHPPTTPCGKNISATLLTCRSCIAATLS